MTINGHILFPDPANWATEPSLSTAWQTGIATGLLGGEARAGFRPLPVAALTWLVTAWHLQQQIDLDARIRAAKKSGRACAPYAGYGSELAAPCNASAALTLESAAYPWAAGDWIFVRGQSFAGPDAPYEVKQVQSVIGLALTLTAALTLNYAAGLQVWPLLFGRFTCGQMDALVSHRGQLPITITELTPAHTSQIGEVEHSGTGIGVWVVEEDFVVT